MSIGRTLSRRLSRCTDEETGFSLIELVVVILIIGVLAGIAIPLFLSQASKADDATAKAQARTAQTAAEVIATENDGSFATVTVSALQNVEPTLKDTSDAILISATPDAGDKGYTVVSQSSNGNTFTIHRAADGTVTRTCVAAKPALPAGCVGGKW